MNFKISSPFRASAFNTTGVLLCVSMLASCGGGSGSTPSDGNKLGNLSDTPSVTTATLTGTVATGRPYPDGTVVTVTDADGNVVGTGQVKGTEGQYSLTLSNPSAKAPLVITASFEGEETLVGIAANTNDGTANVTPITHLIATALSPSGDPASLAKGNTQLLTATAIQSAVTDVNALINSVANYTQAAAAANPLSTSFKADGTGLDRTLDAIKISVRPQGDDTSRIQIYTPAASDGFAKGGIDNPITLTTTASQATSLKDVTGLPAVTNTLLPANGAMTQVQDMMNRLMACYALPKASRGSGGVMGESCKGIFWNSDPSTYKNNSYTVGTATTGASSAWNSIYNNNDNVKVVWEQPQILFISKQTIGGSDVFLPVVQSRWTSTFPCTGDATQTCSNTDIDIYVLRADANGKLYMYGNQSPYDLSVTPRVEYRDLPNYSNYSYYNVGYNLYVQDTGQIGKVVVTSPNGKKITLKPIPGGGYSYMGIAKGNHNSEICAAGNGYNNCVTSTSVLRLAARYKNTATTSNSGSGIWASTNHPRDIDPSLAWSSDSDVNGNSLGWKNWSDDELAKIPEQGNWVFEIYDITGSTVVATEQRRTSNRIPTLAQAQNAIWPTLSSNLRSLVVRKSEAKGGFVVNTPQPIYITSDMTAAGAAGWEVGTGAWAPTSIKVYGSYFNAMPNPSKIGFDDETVVRSSWRQATIKCSGSDGHCSGSGNYKPYVDANTNYSGFGQLQLNGRDVYRVQTSVSINLRNN